MLYIVTSGNASDQPTTLLTKSYQSNATNTINSKAMKVHKVLILIDFSDATEPLLTYSMSLARHLHAEVQVFHAYYIPTVLTGDMYVPDDLPAQYEKNANQKFDAIQKKLPAMQAIPVPFTAISGNLVPEMNRLIDREQINLVVVGNRGGGFMTNILGSNTVKVIQHAHCPVLSVPADVSFQPFRRMALAVDLKNTKSELISLTAEFAQTFGARVDVVHVSDAPIPVDPTQLTKQLDNALEEVTHPFSHVHSADAERGIEKYLTGNNNDLLVLLPRPHSLFDRIFQKSISRQMAFQKKIPLLTLPV